MNAPKWFWAVLAACIVAFTGATLWRDHNTIHATVSNEPLNTSAQGRWVVLGDSTLKGDTVKMDRETISVTSDGLVLAWTKTIWAIPQTDSSSGGIPKSYTSSVEQFYYDCQGQRYTIAQWHLYNAGDVVGGGESRSRKLYRVVPGSLGEGMLRGVCAYAKSHHLIA